MTPSWPKLTKRKSQRKFWMCMSKGCLKSKYLAGENFRLADLSRLPATRYLVSEAGLGHLVKEREKVNA